MNKNQLLLLLFCILFFLFGNLVSIIYNPFNDVKTEYVYFNHSDTPFSKSVGFYAENRYFCVIIGNRTPDEIAGTYTHEVCHHYIANDYKHFCLE